MMDPHCDIFILLSVTLPSSSLGDSSSSAAAVPSDGAGEWLTRPAEGDVKWEDLSVLLPSGSSEVCRCYCCCRKILALTWATCIGLHTSSTKCAQRRENMQMTKWLIFYQSPDCLEACLDLYVICSFLTNVCAYFLFAWDVISLWFVVGQRCFPLSCLSNMRQTPTTKSKLGLCSSVRRRVDTHSASSFSFQFFIGREKKAALNPTSLFIERSEFRPGVHCIYVRHPEWLRRSLAVHYVSLHLPTVFAGFAEMCFAPPPPWCTFLFFDKLIRAAGLKRLFQMCARTRTRTHLSLNT